MSDEESFATVVSTAEKLQRMQVGWLIDNMIIEIDLNLVYVGTS